MRPHRLAGDTEQKRRIILRDNTTGEHTVYPLHHVVGLLLVHIADILSRHIFISCIFCP